MVLEIQCQPVFWLAGTISLTWSYSSLGLCSVMEHFKARISSKCIAFSSPSCCASSLEWMAILCIVRSRRIRSSSPHAHTLCAQSTEFTTALGKRWDVPKHWLHKCGLAFTHPVFLLPVIVNSRLATVIRSQESPTQTQQAKETCSLF